MRCDNELCVYNEEDGTCILDEITVDECGMCADCIMLSFTKEEREERREEMLRSFIEREKDELSK